MHRSKRGGPASLWHTGGGGKVPGYMLSGLAGANRRVTYWIHTECKNMFYTLPIPPVHISIPAAVSTALRQSWGRGPVSAAVDRGLSDGRHFPLRATHGDLQLSFYSLGERQGAKCLQATAAAPCVTKSLSSQGPRPQVGGHTAMEASQMTPQNPPAWKRDLSFIRPCACHHRKTPRKLIHQTPAPNIWS